MAEKTKLNGSRSRLDLLARELVGELYGLGDMVERQWQSEAFAVYRRDLSLAGDRMNFLLHAGVGSGKTLWSAMIASYLLNGTNPKADLVFYVCPNRAIRRAVIREFRKANIHLEAWNKHRAADGPTSVVNGYVATYQATMRDHQEIGRICDSCKALVIFDEIHHLGESLSWHDAAISAFENRARYILGMTGTPFRSDNRKIPFVEYFERPDNEGILTFKPDFSYPLGRAIAEGHCRKPVAHWLEMKVKVKFPDGHVETVDEKTVLPPPMMNRRLNGAVRPGSKNVARAKALAFVVGECRRRNERLIIFVGGDSSRKDCGGIRDATTFLPNELAALGYLPPEICVVTSDKPLSAAKIDGFGASGAKVLVCVNMVSEGVDIPELTAAFFLTSITARSTTIQRVGRVLRGQGEAHIYMFEDPRYREIMDAIEAEYHDEIDMGRSPSDGFPSVGAGNSDRDGEPPSIGVDSRPGGITVGGTYYSEAELKLCQNYASRRSHPEGMTFLSVLLPLARDGVLDKYSD